jgi:hypothetical protein
MKTKKSKDGRANNTRPKKLQIHEQKVGNNIYIQQYKIEALGGKKAVKMIAEGAVNNEYEKIKAKI